MAVGDIKIFTINQGGLTLTIEAIEYAVGKVQFNITSLGGSGDLNAIWWGDGDQTVEGNTTLSKSDNALGMNGSGVTWDGYAKLSNAGLGPAGVAKDTYITTGETLSFKADISLDAITQLGIRATSVNGGDSIKGVDGGADQTFKLPTISIGDASVTEGGKANFTITLSNLYPYPVKVYYQTADGTAASGTDYDAAAGSSFVIIPANTLSAVVAVQTVDDFYAEGVEKFFVNLGSAKAQLPTGDLAVTATDAQGDGTITDDFDATTITLSAPASVDEGGKITVTATVDHTPQTQLVITLNNGKMITIDAGQTSGSVEFDAPGDDPYIDAGTLTFSVGSKTGGNYEKIESTTASTSVLDTIDTTTITLGNTSGTEGGTATISAHVSNAVTGSNLVINLDNGATIVIAVGSSDGVSSTFAIADNNVYGDGTSYAVAISGTTGGNYEALDDDDTATVTVLDNDSPPTFTIDDVTRNENDGTITFTVTKTGATALASSVDFQVNPGTAGTPGDYSGALTGTVSFTAGESTKIVTLNIVNDTIFEPTETFTVDLSYSVNATIVDSQGVGTIQDNDVEVPGGGGNAAPTAGADHWVVSNATQFTIPVDWLTHNDIDPEGPVYVTNVIGAPSGWTANYTAGHLTSITVSSSSGPGPHNFTYELTDAGGTTSIGSVTVDTVQTQGNNATDTINLAVYNPYDHSYVDLKGGDDVGTGGSGLDTFVGGNGKDTLNGSSNLDAFRYETAAHSAVTYDKNGNPKSDTRDTINLFTSGQDKIDLTALDVTNVDTNLADGLAAHSVGWISSGGDTTVYVNTSNSVESILVSNSGSGQTYDADMEIHLTGVAPVFTSDFLI